MKIATRAPILDVDGAQINHTGTQRPATFASIAIPALAQRTQFDREVEELGLLAFMLAKRLHGCEFIDLTPDESDNIRRRVLMHPQYNNIVVGRICEMLDASAAREQLDEVIDAAAADNVTPLR